MTPDNTIQGQNEHFSEGYRKVVHIGLGAIAFALGSLPVVVSAAVAFAAILFNWLVLPRLGGKKISREAQGSDMGIIYYPISVFLLIVLFHDRIEIAAVGWVVMAFGDGLATIVGRILRGPSVPWNREKSILGSLAFLEAGLPMAWLVSHVIGPRDTLLPPLAIAFVTCIVAMIVESLPTGINDNLTVPFAAAATMFALQSIDTIPALALSHEQRIWMLVNVILAVAGFVARTVNVSGFVGGLALGALIIAFGGWQLYVVLLAFFVLGTATTKLGYRKKAGAGLAQEGGGRRGFSHAFANVGMAVILAFLVPTSEWAPMPLWLAAVAALATAAADTTASEIGQLIGRRPFLPLTLKSVPAGTEGAVSVEGTVAGAIAAVVVALIGTTLWISLETSDRSLADSVRLTFSRGKIGWSLECAGLIALAAILGSYLESVAGSWNRRQARPVSNGTLNFLNTAVGAALMLLFAHWL